ncbi:ionic transporter y4hA [Lysobacter sp. HDW10]|uniref:calcium:proton antiporter n=1 Tax=Lysobacter sp. HDW10 TaxID=2714936 RepID=UPI00140B5ED5|nr:ionic transporter y4hA [Lysobacter sp. HDW10]QIK81653.1 ionic transporter y4hA [Lysobacter sp. HDW10]
MKFTSTHNPLWATSSPIIGLLILLVGIVASPSIFINVLLVVCLTICVIAAVHHAEVIAHRVGEPYGTLVLALAVTAIEVALIVSMMIAGGENSGTFALARDTVFAAVMLILNGIIGFSLLAGSRKHHTQTYQIDSITAALITLTAIVTLTLVLPNYTSSSQGPTYTSSQLLFVAIVTLVLFVAFTVFQTIDHRDYFLPLVEGKPADESVGDIDKPSKGETITSLVLLLIGLAVVVISAKKLAPTLELGLEAVAAPRSVVGILIAMIVLLPEGVAAVRAALNDRVQTSLNLAAGSAIASIGLTIPTVAALALIMGWPLELGLDQKSSMLLLISLFITSISLRTGKTNKLIGMVHITLLAVYLFMSVVP